MQLFDYLPSNRLVFGPGTIAELDRLLEPYAAAKILVVTDNGIADAGIIARMMEAVNSTGSEFFVYQDVSENPTTRDVSECLKFAKANGPIDLIIGLGGGSAMDCAKGINFLYSNGGRMQDYWGKNKAPKPMLPSIGIPTTAGTGSEAQSFALISDERTHRKMACGDIKARFETVILDATLLHSIPRNVAMVSSLDALAHALESYVSKPRNAISNMFAREAWSLLSGNFEAVCQDTATPDNWGDMQLGAYFAGLAIENSMLGAAHACANPLTARFGVTHGLAVGIMLPHVIRFNQTEIPELYDELVAGVDAADCMAGFLRNTGMPETLKQCHVSETEMGELARMAVDEWTGCFNPKPLTVKDYQALYEAAYN